MRIDKYLKVSRVLKRRSTGKNLALNDRLSVNGRPAKASTNVKPGDIITVVFGEREISLRVLDVAEHIRKEDAGSLFEIIEEKRKEDDNDENEEKHD